MGREERQDSRFETETLDPARLADIWQGPSPSVLRHPMQQTLFALAAILAFSYYALSRHSTDAEVEHDAITTEIEIAVADVARARLMRTVALAFDEQDVGRTGIRTIAASSTLGPDLGETDLVTFDDVDDIDGWSDTLSVAVGSATVRVRVAGAAEYVQPFDPSGPGVSSPTLAKRIQISAEEVPDGPLRNRVPLSATLTRVVTPTSL